MIIFGWGKQKMKFHGYANKRLCSHCHNEAVWVFHEISTWFSLFFIPVFPYKTEYRLICPVCQYGYNIKPHELNKMKAQWASNSVPSPVP